MALFRGSYANHAACGKGGPADSQAEDYLATGDLSQLKIEGYWMCPRIVRHGPHPVIMCFLVPDHFGGFRRNVMRTEPVLSAFQTEGVGG